MRGHLIHSLGPEWSAAALTVQSRIGGSDFRELKRTRRAVGGFLEINGRRCFVKHVKEGSYLKGLIARVRGSRARRIAYGSAMLAKGRFAHPQVILAAEERRLGAVRASWAVSEALPDARVISLFFLGDGRNLRRRQWLSRLIAREIRRLHDAGLYTRDMQETNLMLEAAGGDVRIYFLDLEDFRHARIVSRKRRLLNLVHLDRSIGRFLARTQRLRFLYNYFGGKPPRAEIRELVRALLQMEKQIELRKRASPNSTIRRTAPEPIRPMLAATGQLQWRTRY
jgi:hypothetical protein